MLTNRQLFLLHNAQTSTSPLMLEVVKAEGNYLFDAEGKKYLDLISGISVSNTGHRHPRVLAAIRHQIDQYLHTMVYGEYVQSPQTLLAKKLNDLLPNHGSFDQQPWASYFTNSGSEATEGAMKLAKRYTGKQGFVSFKNAYHGSTQGALSLMDAEDFKNPFRPLLPGVQHLDFNAIYGLKNITTATAAAFVEMVQSESGYIPADIDFIKALRKRCTETGTLLVVDECQTGLGRTGSFFAFEKHGIVPDIILLAKALGGGMPMGAFVASKPIMDCLSHNPALGHITTFGGHPVCCAAALENISVLEDEKLLETVSEKEKLFRNELTGLSVSGSGLMLSIDLDKFENCKRIIDTCLAKGILSDWFLHAPNKLRIAPPLTISPEEIKWVCGVILESV